MIVKETIQGLITKFTTFNCYVLGEYSCFQASLYEKEVTHTTKLWCCLWFDKYTQEEQGSKDTTKMNKP